MDLVAKLLFLAETCLLVFALLFATKAIKNKDDMMQRKVYTHRFTIYIGLFLILCIVRNIFF